MVQHRVDDEISRQDQIFSAIAKELSLRVSRCDEAFVEVFFGPANCGSFS